MAERRYRNVLLQSFITGQLAAELLRRELSAAGMTPNQYGVQSVIGAFGPLTPTELATRLGMAPPAVSTPPGKEAALRGLRGAGSPYAAAGPRAPSG